MSGNFFAGATAFMRADDPVVSYPPTWRQDERRRVRGRLSPHRALETIARRELGDVGSVLDRLLQGAVTQKGPERSRRRSAHDELLAAFFRRGGTRERPLKAVFLEDARARVDASFGTAARPTAAPCYEAEAPRSS